MEYADRANIAIQKAESQLRHILGDAVKAGAYDEVPLLSDTARTLSLLHQRLLSPNGDSADQVEMQPGSPHDSANQKAAAVGLDERPRLTAGEPGKTQFVRDERHVIKLAWSKSKGNNYEHRAPIEVARLLVKAILREGGAKRLVSSEKFLPLLDPRDKTEVPSYQSYLCLAWLVKEGLVGKNGRRGYTVFKANTVENSMEECWERLPREMRLASE